MWRVLTQLPCEDRDMYSAAVMYNDVYITGGVVNDTSDMSNDVTNETWRYSVAQDWWMEVGFHWSNIENELNSSIHSLIFGLDFINT